MRLISWDLVSWSLMRILISWGNSRENPPLAKSHETRLRPSPTKNSTPLSGGNVTLCRFFNGLRAVLIFSWRPQYIKNLYSENYWRDTSIVFHLGISKAQRRKCVTFPPDASVHRKRHISTGQGVVPKTLVIKSTTGPRLLLDLTALHCSAGCRPTPNPNTAANAY